TIGGIVYQGGSFPAKLENAFIAGNVLSNVIHWHVLEPKGSTFTARFGGELLKTDDFWFRPVDCQVGPDGAVYVADWYDKRANHVDPVDNWDKTNGRVYRIQAKGAKPAAPFDLTKKTTAELVGLLGHRNSWFRATARQLLAERRDPAAYPLLRKNLAGPDEHLALESLWALYVSGGLVNKTDFYLLGHPNPHVRAWVVRLLGDPKKVSHQTAG